MTKLKIIHRKNKPMLSVDQSEGSSTLNFHLADGRVFHVDQSLVVEFIEKSHLNISYEWAGNSGIGEPWLDLDEKEVVIPASEYLDDNFEQVCMMYLESELKSVLNLRRAV